MSGDNLVLTRDNELSGTGDVKELYDNKADLSEVYKLGTDEGKDQAPAPSRTLSGRETFASQCAVGCFGVTSRPAADGPRGARCYEEETSRNPQC